MRCRLVTGNLAFWIPRHRLIIAVFFNILALSKATSLCPANGKISCPCGSTGKVFLTLCDPQQALKNSPCEKFKFCETCKDGSQTCNTCPPGGLGNYCSKDYGHSLWNTTNSIKQTLSHIGKLRSKRGTNCPNLQPPKLGSVKCWFSQTEKECTGRCLPGHRFQNYNGEEIVLRCNRGRWNPMTSFPPCASEGHCDLEMTGAGSFNCTTGSRGTFCDIRCTSGNRWIANRFFCYPGRQWDPQLPYCIRAKEGREPPPPRVNCKCQNGGTCDVNTERCVCPEHFGGRFCENHIYPTKVFCSDPGYVDHGVRRDTEGHVPSRNGQYHEGATVQYSCKNGFELLGSNSLTCRSSATWSSARPTCKKIIIPTSTTTTVKPRVQNFCRDPGFVLNGDRWTSEGRASSRGDKFETGKSVVYSCRDGFALQGLSILTCLESRQWSNILPECKTIREPSTTEDYSIAYCEDPGTDPNAHRTENPWLDAKKHGAADQDDEFPQGYRLEYTCKKGFAMEGTPAILCLFTGTWSAPAPSCRAGALGDTVYCADPGGIQNGQRIVVLSLNARRKEEIREEEPDKEYPVGVKLEYSCLDDFMLMGEKILTCMSTGKWSVPLPECV